MVSTYTPLANHSLYASFLKQSTTYIKKIFVISLDFVYEKVWGDIS